MESIPTSGEVLVVCLILEDCSGAVLAVQRSGGKHLAGKWEFPGGKVEAGESTEDALIREVREELGLEISGLRQLREVRHRYPSVQIRLLPFVVRCAERLQIELHEHTAYRWILPEDWQQLDWAPADVPVIEQLLALKAGKVFCE